MNKRLLLGVMVLGFITDVVSAGAGMRLWRSGLRSMRSVRAGAKSTVRPTTMPHTSHVSNIPTNAVAQNALGATPSLIGACAASLSTLSNGERVSNRPDLLDWVLLGLAGFNLVGWGNEYVKEKEKEKERAYGFLHDRLSTREMDWTSRNSADYPISDFNQLSNQDKAEYAEKYLKKFGCKLGARAIRLFMDNLQNEKKQHYARDILAQQDFYDFSPTTLEILLGLLPNEERAGFARKTLLQNPNEPTSFFRIWYLKVLIDCLSSKEKAEYARKILEKKGRISGCFDWLINYLSDEEKHDYLQLEWFDGETVTARHLESHAVTIGSLYLSTTATPEIKELCIELNDYAAQQEQQDRVVFFHGQCWYWNGLEAFYRELWQQEDKKLDENFSFLRYKKEVLDGSSAKRIARNGVQDYDNDRQHILFANLALFSNKVGSNTPDYVVDNFDQTMLKGIIDDRQVRDIFTDFDLHDEYEQIKKVKPNLFKKFDELHVEASKYGNFVTLSMPKEVADRIAYQTKSGGSRVNRRPISEIVKELKKDPPFESEFAVVLGKEITDPREAAKAGIEIRSVNAANPEILAKRDALIREIVRECKDLKRKKLKKKLKAAKQRAKEKSGRW